MTISTLAKNYVQNGYAPTHEPQAATFARGLASTRNIIAIRVNADGTVVFPATGASALGDTTITGSLIVTTTAAVTGATTLASTLAVTGNVAVNTNKFTVAASSGNTLVAGTLNVTGAQTFTGNTTCSGTLAVTGSQTLTGATTCSSTLSVAGASTLTGATNVVGAFSVNTDKFTVAAASGNTAVAGTLAVTGASTLTGNVACSGTLAVTSTSSFAGKLFPATDDGAALGDTTHHFSDLFLATGAVLNFQNGNVALTHTSGVLTLGTGNLIITTAGTAAGSVVTTTGTQTLTNKTLTAPVIGAATGTSLALTAGLTEGVTTISGDGAVTIASGTVVLTKGSAAAITVAAPSSQDGTKIRIISNSDFAHVITFTGSTLLDGTTGANLTVTMTAFKGSAIEVVAVGTKWLLVSSSNVTSITA